MNTSLTKFKINVLHFTYEISGEIESEEVTNENGFTDIVLMSVKLDKVIQANHEDQRIVFSPQQCENMALDIKSNPNKYPQMIWFLQEQYKDRWDLSHETEVMDIEDREEFREFLESFESC